MDWMSWLVPMAFAAEGDPDPKSGADGETPTPEPTLTQADLDKAIKKRLDRESAKHDKQLREALGIGADEDPYEVLRELRERASRAPDPEDDADTKSKLERQLETQRKQAEAKQAELEQKATVRQQRLTARLIEASIGRAFAAVNDRLTADGALLLEPILRARLGVDDETLEVIPVDENGDRVMVNGKEIEIGDVVLELLEKYPSVVKATGGGGGSSARRTGTVSEIDALLRAHREAPSRQTAEAITSAVLNPKGS